LTGGTTAAKTSPLIEKQARQIDSGTRRGDELRQLAAEAQLLARTFPLFPSAVEQRQRIAAESEGLGRIG
jgi:hypothetical protein